MWVSILVAAVTPGISLLTYFYLKDRYDMEPLRVVVKLFAIGVLLVFPTMFVQRGMMLALGEQPFVSSFIVSGGMEELLKWFIIFFLMFRQPVFNEPYDGVVYTVALSLGFATLENVLYALAQPAQPLTLLIRALLPVSGHALFAVLMGYYFGKAKFSSSSSRKYILFALLLPFIAHGTFNYILLAFNGDWTWVVIPFIVFLWILSMYLVRRAIDRSPFRYGFREDGINLSANGQ